MGNTLEQKEEKLVHPETLHKNDFTFHHVIGRGGFGRVWKVEMRKTHQVLAMKEMLKFRVVSHRSVYSIMNERRLLAILKHPFIVNMQYAFQDKDNLYLGMDLMIGGDLRFHLSRVRRFTEEETRFFVACIVTGLEYLHVNGIIHRDIKPENLVFDNKGYLRITDFGIAKVLVPGNFRDTSGTPGYMAPEVINREDHGVAVDYFALGVLTYEFMLGRRPYYGRNRREIRDSMMSRQVQLKKSDVPADWSMEAADFINKLLQRKPQNRLGNNGPNEVKNHLWLRDFQWKKLLEKSLEAPYLCLYEDNFDPSVNNDWKDDIDPAIRQNSIEGLFEGYFFDARSPQRDEKIQLQRGEESTVQIRYQDNKRRDDI